MGQCAPRKGPLNIANISVDAIANGIAPARQADLPKHCRKGDRHPQRLFAKIGALHTSGDADHGPTRCHPACKRLDRQGVKTCYLSSPRRVFCLPIFLAQQVGFYHIEPDCVCFQKRRIGVPFDQQRMCQPHHQCGIRARLDGHPIGLQHFLCVAAQGADIDEFNTCVCAFFQVVCHAMFGNAAIADLRIAQRHAAKHHNQIAVLCNDRPTGCLGNVLTVRANNKGH